LRNDKRRYELTLDVLCAIAQGRAAWEAHWSTPADAEAAFEALRPGLRARIGETYAEWCAREFAFESGPDPRAPSEDEPEPEYWRRT